MRRLFANGEVAVTTAAAVLFVLGICLTLQGSIPQELYVSRTSGNWQPGLAFGVISVTTVLSGLLLAILPALFVPMPVSGASSDRTRRFGFLLGVALLCLMLGGNLATVFFQGSMGVTALAATAMNATWQAMLVASLVPAALVAVMLALLSQKRGFAVLVGGVSALILIASAVIPFSGLPNVAFLIVVLVVALALRQAFARRLSARAGVWVSGLAAAWTVPWILTVAPGLVDALTIHSPVARMEAIGIVLLLDHQLFHLVMPVSLLLCLGTIAALRQGGAARIGDWLAAAGLAIIVALPETAVALGLFSAPPLLAWEALRSGETGSGAALLSAGAYAADWIHSPAVALASGWLYLRWDRSVVVEAPAPEGPEPDSGG